MPAGFTNHMLSALQAISITVPKDYTGAAATNEWVNLGKYKRMLFIIHTGAWAAGTAAVTINEGKTAAGGSTQALEFDYMWTNNAAATSPTLVKTAVTADTFTIGVANSLYIVELDANELSQGFDFVNMAIASPGANADLYCVLAIMGEPRNPAGPASLESGVT